MKKSRYTDSQIMAILKQAEAGTPVSELCREHGMSSATFYKWRAKYGGMDASLMARMKELEEENRRLKKMYAEECLKAEIIQEALQKSGKAVGGKPLAFRGDLSELIRLCRDYFNADDALFSLFYLSWKKSQLHPSINKQLEKTLKNIANTIKVDPIQFSDKGNMFAYDAASKQVLIDAEYGQSSV